MSNEILDKPYPRSFKGELTQYLITIKYIIPKL